MATPNRFFSNGFPTTQQAESRLFEWGRAYERKARVHKMATPLGTVRVELEYKLGKMWLLISGLIDTYFCVLFCILDY